MTPFNNDEHIRVLKTNRPSGFQMNNLDIYHSYFAIGLRLTGESVISTLEKTFPVKENDIIIIGNELLHRSSYNSPVEVIGFRIQFDYSVYERLCSLLGKDKVNDLINQVVIHVQDSKVSEIKSLFNVLHQEYATNLSTNNNYSKEIQFSLLYILFMKIMMYQKPYSLNESDDLPIQTTISKALIYIETNYAKDPSLSETASYCHISESYLSRQFKNLFNMSYSQYLNKIKVNCAKNLLIKTTLPLNEIALQSGFSSQNYFSYVFRNEIEMSPLQYRKQFTT